MGEAEVMEELFAEAQYEGECNPPEDDCLAWHQVSIPEARADSPGNVASYLRFGGRLSNRVLMQFVWKGQRYDPMGRKLTKG